MTKTKLAIIGLGGVAQIIHLPILSKMEDAEIVAVCDSEISKAKSIASKYNVGKYYREADKMLEENPDISAIIIATQTNMHKDVAIKCLEAEKDILVEKPVARNYREAKEIIDAAKKYKRKIMVAMNNRFRNDMMMQRTFIKAKEIGEVFYIKTGWIKPQSSNQRWILERTNQAAEFFWITELQCLILDFGFSDFPTLKA